jgi:hypothetical protein
LNTLRAFVDRAKIQRLERIHDTLIERFGTHSLRRGGAQALALAGWPLESIKFFGRWLSDAIEQYLLDIPFKVRGHLMASSMAPTYAGAGEVENPICPQVRSVAVGELRMSDALRVQLPMCPEVTEAFRLRDESAELAGLGWFDVLVYVLSGDNSPVNGRRILKWDHPQAEEVTQMPIGGKCPVGYVTVVPKEFSPPETSAICFNLSVFVWIRA